jgi:flagellar biosynthesis/type III secretory pathway protein FliH
MSGMDLNSFLSSILLAVQRMPPRQLHIRVNPADLSWARQAVEEAAVPVGTQVVVKALGDIKRGCAYVWQTGADGEMIHFGGDHA